MTGSTNEKHHLLHLHFDSPNGYYFEVECPFKVTDATLQPCRMFVEDEPVDDCIVEELINSEGYWDEVLTGPLSDPQFPVPVIPTLSGYGEEVELVSLTPVELIMKEDTND
jgi:hypothetical protein